MTVFLVVENLGEKLHILVQDREYIEGDQMEVLEMKTLMPDMKITVDGIIMDSIAQKKRLMYVKIEQKKLLKNETKKDGKNEQSMDCGAISKLPK